MKQHSAPDRYAAVLSFSAVTPLGRLNTKHKTETHREALCLSSPCHRRCNAHVIPVREERGTDQSRASLSSFLTVTFCVGADAWIRWLEFKP